MSNTPDLSRVVQLIMENPKLIEEISNLAKDNSNSTVEEAVSPEPSPPPVPVEVTQKEEAQASVPTVSPPASSATRRTQLLGALKPYVSEERAKAIDSMMTIAEILDMMRTR